MRPIAICLSVTFVSPAKANERIEVTFEWVTQIGAWNHVLDGLHILHGEGQFGGIDRPTEKHCESLLRQFTQQKINNGISATAAADCIAPD